MNTNRDLEYRLYVQKTAGFTRNSFQREIEGYKLIQQGEVEAVRQRFEKTDAEFLEGKGRLSDDPVRNLMYHFVTSIALISRFCIEGGLVHDTAYTLSDIYIRRADKCRTCEEILEIFAEMRVDFAKRMRALKKENVISLHVRKCIDYIYEHLNERLLLSELAELVGLNASYLSKLFAKETGMPIKEFVINAKIRTAENLLKFSDFSSTDIAFALGFSSQSAFISTFRRISGTTPKNYRKTNYMTDVDEMEHEKNSGQFR